MSSATAMSFFAETSLGSFSSSTFEIFNNFINESFIHYQGKRLSRSKHAEDSISKRKFLQLIKKAYLPGCTDEIIDHLNKQDFNVNETVSPSGLTFFLCGCLSGDKDLIQHMLDMGADVKCETSEGDAALYLATYAVLHSPAAQTNTQALRALITAGCNVNKQNRRGFTPLHRAASKGNLKVIDFLLLHGADPYIANNAGVYPIDSAVCSGHIEAAGLLQLKLPCPYVWDVVEPHTPPHIRMGLQSPQRHPAMGSFKQNRLRNVFT